jgi:hypothetical protein
MSYESVIHTENFLSIHLNRIIPLGQLNKLIITYYSGSFTKIFELIRCAPNIQTLEIGFLSFDGIDLLLFEQTNYIQNMTINYQFKLEEIKLLFNLCSRLKQLTIEKFQGDFYALLQFLLAKDENKPRHLTSLFLKRVPHNEIERVKNFVQLKKLLEDYSMKVESSCFNHLYLWW